MPARRIRNLLESRIGNEPERFQLLTDPDPDRSWLQQIFAIDIRALAVLRIAMGLILILEVISHSVQADLLFSDQGILTRALNRQYVGDGYWSLYWINGAGNYAQMLLIITGLAAASFMLGFQTRVMSVVCLLLLWSLQVRNPLILTGGGVLLRMLFFWSVFLPMGVIWSVDASRAEERPERFSVSSVASAGMLLQVVFMYFFTGLAKLNPFWLDGESISYAMQLEMSVKPLGVWLQSWPGLMKYGTWAVLVAELLTLPVMFLPRLFQFNRGCLMAFFWLMHLAIWLTMSIGTFSLTAMAAWIIFIPSDIWSAQFGDPVGHGRSDDDEVDWFARLAQVVCGLFLIYITVQNIANAMGPQTASRLSSLEQFGRTTMTIQQFHMFARPPFFSPWFEYTATLESGERADLFSHRHKNPGNKPDSVYDYLGTQTWRRLHWNLITNPLYPPETELVYREIRQRLLLEMVRMWNADHLNDQVVEAELICHLVPIRSIVRQAAAEDLEDDELESEQVFAEEMTAEPKLLNHQQRNVRWAIYDKAVATFD